MDPVYSSLSAMAKDDESGSSSESKEEESDDVSSARASDEDVQMSSEDPTKYVSGEVDGELEIDEGEEEDEEEEDEEEVEAAGEPMDASEEVADQDGISGARHADGMSVEQQESLARDEQGHVKRSPDAWFGNGVGKWFKNRQLKHVKPPRGGIFLHDDNDIVPYELRQFRPFQLLAVNGEPVFCMNDLQAVTTRIALQQFDDGKLPLELLFTFDRPVDLSFVVPRQEQDEFQVEDQDEDDLEHHEPQQSEEELHPKPDYDGSFHFYYYQREHKVTPIEYALQFGDPHAVRLLLENDEVRGEKIKQIVQAATAFSPFALEHIDDIDTIDDAVHLDPWMYNEDVTDVLIFLAYRMGESFDRMRSKREKSLAEIIYDADSLPEGQDLSLKIPDYDDTRTWNYHVLNFDRASWCDEIDSADLVGAVQTTEAGPLGQILEASRETWHLVTTEQLQHYISTYCTSPLDTLFNQLLCLFDYWELEIPDESPPTRAALEYWNNTVLKHGQYLIGDADFKPEFIECVSTILGGLRAEINPLYRVLLEEACDQPQPVETVEVNDQISLILNEHIDQFFNVVHIGQAMPKFVVKSKTELQAAVQRLSSTQQDVFETSNTFGDLQKYSGYILLTDGVRFEGHHISHTAKDILSSIFEDMLIPADEMIEAGDGTTIHLRFQLQAPWSFSRDFKFAKAKFDTVGIQPVLSQTQIHTLLGAFAADEGVAFDLRKLKNAVYTTKYAKDNVSVS